MMSLRGAAPRLFTSIRGRGTDTVVFLPGMGGTSRYWGAAGQRMDSGFRSVLVDPLGFGLSPKPWKRYTLDAHLDALDRTLAPEPPFIVVGHSLGAILALAYALMRPEQVRGLVLLGLPCFRSHAEARAKWRELASPYAWVASHYLIAAGTCLVTRRIMAHWLPALLPDVPRVVAEDLTQHTWLSSTSTLWNVVFGFDAGAAAARISPAVPVACVHGTADTTAPLAAVRSLMGRSGHWSWTVLDGVDHHPWLRAPAECLAAIQDVRSRSADPSHSRFAERLNRISS